MIMLCIEHNVVLIFNFLPAVYHPYEPFENITLTKNGFNKVQKNIQEMRLQILKASQDNPKNNFLNFFTPQKTFHDLKIFLVF